MRALLRLARGIDRLNAGIGRGVSYLALVMVAIGAWNAVVRKLHPAWSANTFLEAQWYCFSLLFLLSAPAVLAAGGHVRVDLLYSRLSTRGRQWVDLLGTTLLLIPFCAMMLRVSVPMAYASWRILEQSGNPGGLPRYPVKMAIPVAFLLLLLQGLSEAVKGVAALASSDRTQPPPSPPEPTVNAV